MLIVLIRRLISRVIGHFPCYSADFIFIFFQAKETKAAKTKKAAERVDDSKYDLYINFSCPASRDKD